MIKTGKHSSLVINKASKPCLGFSQPDKDYRDPKIPHRPFLQKIHMMREGGCDSISHSEETA
jgi:hypothetical protein